MNENDQRKAAKAFAEKWKGVGDEKQHTHTFWIELFQKVFGVEDATDQFKFEYRVKREAVSGKRDTTVTFIDALVPSTRVLIEQKSITVDLDTAYEQSDKQGLTPYAQAMQYNAWLPADLRAKWIVVCNFDEFRIHDLNDPMGKPAVVRLADLADNFHALDFMIDSSIETVKVEEEISVKAGEIVGKLYDRFLNQYPKEERENPDVLKDINRLCVRIVFCLYAEDAGIFKYGQFRDFLGESNLDSMHEELQKLFEVLNTPYEKRARFLKQSLKDFPYVNGGLFASVVEVPSFDEAMREFLLDNASARFNWKDISPTIFGAVFESTLNPETRREGGMHYTSVENIKKVICPLFLDSLTEELEKIKKSGAKRSDLFAFQEKLSSLKFFDPACGSGNFLTETYLQLRKLENEVIELLYGRQQSFDVEGLTQIKVNINQFYGIEINDFAISVAQTALWIAEHQMMERVSGLIKEEFLPLHNKSTLIEGNALTTDWESIFTDKKNVYIIGNPPFNGAMKMKGKRSDIYIAFPECQKIGEVDYVAGWYVKAAKFIQGTNIRCALVSTNSICQGQSVYLVWQYLIEQLGIKIDFAYHTFVWNNDSVNKGMAKVHCVIVGFSTTDTETNKVIFKDGHAECVTKINPYLLEEENFFVDARTKPLCDISPMHMGVMARDGNNLILSEEEYKDYVKAEPQGVKFIKRYMMGREFINNIPRYCFWLKDANVAEVAKCPKLLERIEAVRQHRLSSPAESTRAFADTPMLFCQLAQPTQEFIAFPKVSTQRRKYIPIDFLSKEVIVGDKVYVVENVGEYEFGILTSSVHNAWMRTVAGRLKSDYSYSNTIVYNNFVWPNSTEAQRKKIEQSAKDILTARANQENASLAKLYDPLTMPPDLVKAHKLNDKLVLNAYGLKANASESEIVSHLMKLYLAKVSEVEKTEAIDAVVQKVIGKKVETVPDWMQELRQQCLDGAITLDELTTQGKARLKEEKKAKEAEKEAAKASKK